MKQLNLLKIILPVIFYLCTAGYTIAQPDGSYFYNAINAGTLSPYSTFSDTQNNEAYNGFGDDFGQPSDDIFYVFTLNNSAEVNISHCYSPIDTYMYLLDVYGNIIASNDDNGPLCAGLKASIITPLTAGTYYVVSEGYGSNSGYITTEISITTYGPPGSTLSNPIDAGTLLPGAAYTDTKNNSPANGYGNDFGQPSNDIYYKFTLNSPAKISISHCGSIMDTYMYLLDEYGAIIEVSDDNGPVCSGLQASIIRQLAAGTYYAVSEGYGSTAGNIITEISSIMPPNGDFDFSQVADSLLQHLDKSGVTTGILYDRVFPLSGINEFNKNYPDTSSHWHFIQAYSELYRSAYNNSGWAAVDDMQELALSKKLQGIVAIGLGNYQLNVIDTNAIASGLIQMIDSMYYDIPGRPHHPFQTINSFVASPLVDSIAGPVVTYEFSPANIFNKSSVTITSMQVDFDDGNGLINTGLNGSINITYNSDGYKYLKFVAGLSNSTAVTTYAVIKITGSSTPLQSSGTNTFSCDIQDTFGIWSKLSFQGYDETSATNGYGEVKIYYAANGSCDGVLRKPIIVVDGFDPGDERDAKKLYNDYLNKGIPGTPRFADDMRSKGYDIVILNFPQYIIGSKVRDGGADYIERNARVLMALIDTVNAMKQGSEKLVIIGPSMGGLISRYALAYMEQHNKLHDTRLWISFDSPHLGANIPIGDQWFLDFYAEKTGSEELKANRDKKISSIAAKQMLVHHYLANSELPQGAPGYRNRFIDTLNNIGFPQGDPGQPFRKIALVDGSLGGIEVNSPGQKAFTFDIRRRKTTFFFIRWKSFTVSAAKMYFTPSYGFNGATVFDAWYLFASKIYRASTPSFTSGYDVAPGGTFDTQGVLYDEGNKTVEKKFLMAFIAEFYSVIRDHSFISTKSALAFTGANQNLSENISTRNLVCTSETPFDSYFGSFTQNREHVELWAEGIDWITKEIDGIPQFPSVDYSTTYAISGPSSFCTSQSYSVSNLPAGATVNWTYTGGVSGPSTGNPITATKSYNGTGTLTANIVTSCDNATVSKTISAGAIPVIPSIISSGHLTDYSNLESVYADVCAPSYSNTVHINLSGVQNLQAYAMSGSNPTVVNTSVYWPFPAGYPSGTLRLEYDVSCGPVIQYISFYNTCNYSAFTIYPNPADNELIVSYGNKVENEQADNNYSMQPVSEKSQAPPFEIKLFNNKGKILRSVKNNNGKRTIIINTADIPNGIYFLHFIQGKEVIKEQIIIQH